MPSLRDTLIILLVSLLLGVIGASPALLFNTGIFIIGATLLATWFPLKLLIDSQVKGDIDFKLPNISLNQISLPILAIIAIPILGILYFNTIVAFVISTLVYRFTTAGLALSLILALVIHIVRIYQGAQREKAMGVNNRIFVHVNDFNQSAFNIQLDPSTVHQQSPREDLPEVIYLPEDNLRDRSQDTDSEPMTLNIDPSTVREQSDDET